jgi:hypothetical protein
MADTTRKGNAGIGGTGEDATSKTPIDKGRNVGAGRAGGAGTVADDGARAQRHAEHEHLPKSDGDTDTTRNRGDRPTPILDSDTIGVGAGNASDRPTRMTDAAPAYVPRDVYGTGDRARSEDAGSTGSLGPVDGAQGAPGPGAGRSDAAAGRGGADSARPGSLAAISGEAPSDLSADAGDVSSGGSDAIDRREKPGFLNSLDDQRPGR